MDFVVSSRSRKVKKYFEALLPSMIEQLGLESSRKALFVTCEPCEQMGFTVPIPFVDGIIVSVKSRQSIKDLGLTLAHEMVHVKQIARGHLKSVGNGAHTWKGKRYKKNTEYLSCPWEVEAYMRQELIFRRALCE